MGREPYSTHYANQMKLNNAQKLGATALVTGGFAAVPALFSSPLLVTAALLSPAVAWKFYKGGKVRRTLYTLETPLVLRHGKGRVGFVCQPPSLAAGLTRTFPGPFFLGSAA